MPTYISPNGNPEVWETKPKGYFTPEEWQAAHPAPEPEPLTPEQQAEQRRQEILAELDRIDRASARSLRAITTAQTIGQTPDSADIEALTGYETAAIELRQELAALNA